MMYWGLHHFYVVNKVHYVVILFFLKFIKYISTLTISILPKTLTIFSYLVSTNRLKIQPTLSLTIFCKSFLSPLNFNSFRVRSHSIELHPLPSSSYHRHVRYRYPTSRRDCPHLRMTESLGPTYVEKGRSRGRCHYSIPIELQSVSPSYIWCLYSFIMSSLEREWGRSTIVVLVKWSCDRKPTWPYIIHCQF